MSEWDMAGLCEQVSRGSTRARLAAAAKLATLRDERAEPALFEALSDHNRLVRTAAAHALIEIDGWRSPRPLVDALRAAEGAPPQREPWQPPDAKEILHLGLARLKSLRPVEIFTEALQSPDHHVKSLAATVLGETGDVAATRALIKALDDEQASVREAAAEALGKLQDPEAIEPLTERLDDDGILVRYFARRALAKIPGGRSAMRLAKKTSRRGIGQAFTARFLRR